MWRRWKIMEVEDDFLFLSEEWELGMKKTKGEMLVQEEKIALSSFFLLNIVQFLIFNIWCVWKNNINNYNMLLKNDVKSYVANEYTTCTHIRWEIILNYCVSMSLQVWLIKLYVQESNLQTESSTKFILPIINYLYPPPLYK